MTETVRSEYSPNRVLEDSIKHPVRMMVILFIIAVILKILDSFVFRLGDLLGELIFTKALGFVMLVVYLSLCGRKLRDIGFHRRKLGQSLLISGVCVGGLFAVAFVGQLIALRAGGEDARFVLSAVDPKTGMTGGLWFGVWLSVGNLVNSAMEEGLFRGAMLRHFRIKLSVWGAILLQALFFALWHLDGPVKQLVTGQATPGEAGFGALSILLATGIGGLMYGYLYHKTDNLWAPYLAHTINNTVLNILFFRTSGGLQSGYEFGLFLALWLPGYLVLIPIVGWWANRLKLPEVKPWGQFVSSENE
jgi:membrane protease YdiL (CAAX protease family)